MNIQPFVTPIPIIDKTGSSIDVLQALITAGFAVLSGFILYALKCIVEEYWLRNLRKYKELKANTEYILTFYANAYGNVVEENDELHEEASSSIREVAAKIGSFAIERPMLCLCVPKRNILEAASKELMGLSNGMVAKGEQVFRKLEKNDKHVEEIRRLLDLAKT